MKQVQFVCVLKTGGTGKEGGYYAVVSLTAARCAAILAWLRVAKAAAALIDEFWAVCVSTDWIVTYEHCFSPTTEDYQQWEELRKAGNWQRLPVDWQPREAPVVPEASHVELCLSEDDDGEPEYHVFWKVDNEETAAFTEAQLRDLHRELLQAELP